MNPLSIVTPIALAAGLGLGLLVDAVGSAGRINILAPPLLGLLLWNLAVYLMLAVGLGRASRTAGPLRRALARHVEVRHVAPALHAGAAAFALGALAAMYLRGIAFEYRAGWETTFLSVDTVHRLLAVVLGPASRLTGLPLPSVAELDALHFRRGGGENAARWIHLYAVTVLVVVVLPRALLALLAARQARRAPAADNRAALAMRVLPYSYRVPPQALPALAGALERNTGRRVAMSVAEPLPLGAEDELERLLPADTPPALAALFTLSATPETENHGAFVAALAARTREPLVVLVDESAFVRRFTGPDAIKRRDERRRAWREVMQKHGVTPQFVDLGA